MEDSRSARDIEEESLPIGTKSIGGSTLAETRLQELIEQLEAHIDARLPLEDFAENTIAPFFEEVSKQGNANALKAIKADPRFVLLHAIMTFSIHESIVMKMAAYHGLRKVANTGLRIAISLRAELAESLRYEFQGHEFRDALQAAAEAGFPKWMYHYAFELRSDKQLPKHMQSEWRTWLLRAIRHRDPEAMCFCGTLLGEGDTPFRKFLQVIRFNRRAAKLGDAVATRYVALFEIEYPQLRMKNDAKILDRWMAAALSEPTGDVALGLGMAMWCGLFAPCQPEIAVQLFKIAWDKGNVSSASLLSLAYFAGLGCSADQDESTYWEKQGAAKGDSSLRASLAWCQLGNLSTNSKDPKAVAALKSHADAQSVESYISQVCLAILYSRGIGVKKSSEAAMKYLKMAEECWRMRNEIAEPSQHPGARAMMLGSSEQGAHGTLPNGRVGMTRVVSNAPDSPKLYLDLEDIEQLIERQSNGQLLVLPEYSRFGGAEAYRLAMFCQLMTDAQVLWVAQLRGFTDVPPFDPTSEF